MTDEQRPNGPADSPNAAPTAPPTAEPGRQPAAGAAPAASEAPAHEAGAGDEERARLKEQLMRTAADFENFRKRARRDVEEAERRGAETALKEVLPVIDNLERAAEAAEGAPSAEAVATGVQMVLRQFQDAASRLSLERVAAAVGQRFDPTLHDAVQQQETGCPPPGQHRRRSGTRLPAQGPPAAARAGRRGKTPRRTGTQQRVNGT